MGNEALPNGLYMIGYYIQLSKREFTDRETGEVKNKYYLMVSAGQVAGGSCNVGITVEEYAAIMEKGLRVGAVLLVPAEAFGYRDRVYFRAVGPVSVVDK